MREKDLRKVWNRLFGSECEHTHALVVSSVGVRRTVCEDCGNISFEMEVTPIWGIQRNHGKLSELPGVSGL